MLESLIAIDHSISLAINSWSAPWLDGFMVFVSEKFAWIPLYAAILFSLFRKFDWKTAVVFTLTIVLGFGLSDQISVAFKFVFERLRPCHDEVISQSIRTLVNCGGKFGFVSSHASNTMSLTVLVGLIFRKKYVWTIMLLYTILNGYSRIYLGKHFFGDVIGGYLLGIFVAFLTFEIAKKAIQYFNLKR